MTTQPSIAVREFLQEWAAARMSECAPGLDAARRADGNPPPYAAMLTWEEAFHVVLIHPAYMENIETKENLVVMLRQHIRKHRAQAVALMSPVWRSHAVVAPGEDPREARARVPNRLSDDPQASEHVMIWSVSQFSRALFSAAILRRADGPPTLGPWGEMGGMEEDRFTNRLQQSVIAVA